jgi:hypothetical protein
MTELEVAMQLTDEQIEERINACQERQLELYESLVDSDVDEEQDTGLHQPMRNTISLLEQRVSDLHMVLQIRRDVYRYRGRKS